MNRLKKLEYALEEYPFACLVTGIGMFAVFMVVVVVLASKTGEAQAAPPQRDRQPVRHAAPDTGETGGVCTPTRVDQYDRLKELALDWHSWSYKHAQDSSPDQANCPMPTAPTCCEFMAMLDEIRIPNDFIDRYMDDAEQDAQPLEFVFHGDGTFGFDFSGYGFCNEPSLGGGCE